MSDPNDHSPRRRGAPSDAGDRRDDPMAESPLARLERLRDGLMRSSNSPHAFQAPSVQERSGAPSRAAPIERPPAAPAPVEAPPQISPSQTPPAPTDAAPKISSPQDFAAARGREPDGDGDEGSLVRALLRRIETERDPSVQAERSAARRGMAAAPVARGDATPARDVDERRPTAAPERGWDAATARAEPPLIAARETALSDAPFPADDARDASPMPEHQTMARRWGPMPVASGGATAPFSAPERMLAGRYLRARRKEGFISVIALLSLIGIALGVAILIIVMSVMNGFRAELVSKIVGVNGHIMVSPYNGEFPDYEEVAERVAAVPGVTRAAPLIEGQAFVSTRARGFGVLVRGLRPQDMNTLERVAQEPEFSEGSLARFAEGDGVALGSRLARKLGVGIGDTVTLLSPRGRPTAFGVAPRRKSYEVIYIFKVGMAHYDEGVMFMPLDESQQFFLRENTVDAIETMVATPENLDGFEQDIQSAVGRPVFISNWMDMNGSLIGALKMERNVMFLILSFLILIASLIIISGMIMLVKEKGRDIAILRTMGMSRGAVLRVFFMCGASIGLFGTLAGVCLGLLFCWRIDDISYAVSQLTGGPVFPAEVYILSQLPAQVHTQDVAMAVGISLGLSFLATLYPARRAAKLDPVEALRYE